MQFKAINYHFTLKFYFKEVLCTVTNFCCSETPTYLNHLSSISSRCNFWDISLPPSIYANEEGLPGWNTKAHKYAKKSILASNTHGRPQGPTLLHNTSDTNFMKYYNFLRYLQLVCIKHNILTFWKEDRFETNGSHVRPPVPLLRAKR